MSNQNTEASAAKRRLQGHGRRRHAVLVGPMEDLRELSAELNRRPSGVAVDGVFSASASWQMPEGMELKGSPADLRSYLDGGNQVDDA